MNENMIRRSSYVRKSYTRKDGTKVKGSKVKSSLIKDLGKKVKVPSNADIKYSVLNIW